MYGGNFVEQRTDNYVVVNDGDYGLKFRHGKQLELKIKTEAHLNIEAWYKERYDVKMKQMKISKLLTKLKEKYKKDKDMSKIIQCIETNDSFIVECKKERRTSSVDGLGNMHLSRDRLVGGDW